MSANLLKWRADGAAHFGRRPYRRSMSVLISSPKMSAAHHSDVPGQSLWQARERKRACPHRVVNGDCVNISFTTEHWTDELRAGYAVDYANGVLRPWLGGHDLSRRTPAQLAMTIDFRVDPSAPGGFVDIEPCRVAR
ncbi:hypothetical protein K9U39_04510 [Rhodoblastus acidophilus]|uniref:Uncharacterized protein n=1 Tax=Candidatus Rhodoblastus alkanivorans TaxID=2954117 RepID=A0ABS9Z5E9_9HYPH|nr:hypothetical protein [Candidatus Rhodoblastus alkanivorans]MCI4678424.1 hypothetical protein [Candidatus Rhodoblastus alkanivorans]MCI4682903.1 hypothetical protein [Candidatus Rhodoblastus alkanivorans]MDI4640213.1 hypothetical protein [Rhodoblastus acidophilus]